MINYNEKLSYEIFEDGYDIYDRGRLWITQHEPYANVIVPNGTYTENAIAHCAELSQPALTATDTDKLRADLDYIALMMDLDLPSEEEQEDEE